MLERDFIPTQEPRTERGHRRSNSLPGVTLPWRSKEQAVASLPKEQHIKVPRKQLRKDAGMGVAGKTTAEMLRCVECFVSGGSNLYTRNV